MKLLIERVEDVQFLTEDTGKGKNLYITGIFMQCVPNRNKRLYPEEVLHKEVRRYTKDVINEHRAFGELTHPTHPTIDLKNVSHLIESLDINGKNIYGKARILDTPSGNIVKGILEGGGSIGVSSRGLGSVKPNNGLNVVQEDFRLVTAADCVADPSAPDAFVSSLMENTEWFFDAVKGTWAQQLVEPLKEEIKSMPKRRLDEEYKLGIFKRFMDAISKPTQSNK